MSCRLMDNDDRIAQSMHSSTSRLSTDDNFHLSLCSRMLSKPKGNCPHHYLHCNHHLLIMIKTFIFFLSIVMLTDWSTLIGVNGTRIDIPDPPGRPLITGFTSRSANLSWTAPLFDNLHHPILHYLVGVRVGENGDWGDSSTDIQTPDNRTNYEVRGLSPFTVYAFRVTAVNSQGFSLPSKESYYMVTLREVPEGRPIITYSGNTSSTSIMIQWNVPARSSIHGEFIGYKVRFWPRDHPSRVEELLLKDPDLRALTLKELTAFTQYLVSISVVNPAGDGPPTTVSIMTDEGVPSPPLNLTLVRVGDAHLKLKWEEPEFPRGIIRGYHVYILNLVSNVTDVKKVINPSRSMEFTASHLKPFTPYKIWVRAFTWREEGESSRIIEVRTDVQGPSAPKIVNVTCVNLDSLYLQWERPTTYYNQIDYYFVYYRPEESWIFEEVMMDVGNGNGGRVGDYREGNHEITIGNLTAGTLYEVKVQGASRSIVESSRLVRGEFSPARKVVLQSKCESYSASPLLEPTISASVVVGLLCFSLVIFFILASFMLWRKYFQAAYYYLDDPPSRSSPQLSETYDESEYQSIPVPLWPKHVQDLHADGDIGFSREYEAIQAGSDVDLPSEHSTIPDNKGKNRYVNIVAYDHSRVILKPLPGHKNKSHNDYINANYIDGYNKSRAYIGTQGPLPSTFDDYWRMVWEQRICIIVMITNLIERGRRKCDMYWPKEGTETYGIIQVKLLQEVVMATYTLRTFSIRNLKVKKKHGCERTVYQYHYTNWPDHGVPDHPLPVLSFIRKSAAANPPSAGPIIVHCSAGVGRTGTYIVIDAMLKQIKDRQSLNIFSFLKHIRHQRNHLVQTEEQYIFTHDAMLEAIESGDTEVPSTHLTRYIQTLQTGGDNLSTDDNNTLHSGSGISLDIKFSDTLSRSVKSSGGMSHITPWSLLEKQFKLVTGFRAKDFNVVSALKPCNKGKNRSLNLIPLEGHRVHITPRNPGTDGSDFINATFLPGFTHLKEFIVTQHPLVDTIADFWQMVWDHNSLTIVVLSSVVDDKEFPQFWPEQEEESDFGSFKVKLTNEKTMYQETGGYITTRDFIIQSTQDDYELSIRLIHCPGWPESCGPLSAVFDLIKMVQDWHGDQCSPAVVVDRYGGTEAATFCALTTLFKQLNFEDCVDAYMYAKLYHLRRPGIWRSQDDYLFLYRAMESLVAAMSISDASHEGPPSTFGSQLTVSNGVPAAVAVVSAGCNVIQNNLLSQHNHHPSHHHVISGSNSHHVLPANVSSTSPLNGHAVKISLSGDSGLAVTHKIEA